jgi:hypothetical protein
MQRSSKRLQDTGGTTVAPQQRVLHVVLKEASGVLQATKTIPFQATCDTRLLLH